MINKFLSSLRLRLSYLKLSHKFLLICLMSALIPFVIFLIILNTIFQSNAQNDNLNSLESSFTMTYTTISNQMEMVQRSASLLLSNPHIRELLQNRPYNYNFDEQYAEKVDVDNLLRYIEQEDYVSSLQIYIPDTFTYLIDGRNYIGSSLIQPTRWYQYLQENNSKSLWISSPNDGGVLFYAVKAVSMENYKVSYSTIKIDLSADKLLGLLSKAATVQDSTFLIMDTNKNVILSSSDFQAAELLSNYSVSNAGKWDTQSTSNDTYYIYSDHFTDSNLYLVTLVSQKSLSAFLFSETSSSYLSILIVSSIIIFLVSFWFSSTITRRITAVATAMSRIQDKQNLTTVPTTNVHDEIFDLTVSYNMMVHEMKGMIEREYLSGVSQRNAEFRALRAQINPHFLYNTLEIINYYAEEQNPDIVNELITNLAVFYKISLSSGQDCYPFSQELALLEAYIAIINIRYQNAITLVTDISTEFYDCEIPKITLQPIVENAIVHGILEKPDKKGTIKLSAEYVGRNMIISVTDDGIGMSPEMVYNLNHTQDIPYKELSKNHYGISNINQRLKSVYGNSSGLTYSSELGKGTIAYFTIPRRKFQ